MIKPFEFGSHGLAANTKGGMASKGGFSVPYGERRNNFLNAQTYENGGSVHATVAGLMRGRASASIGGGFKSGGGYGASGQVAWKSFLEVFTSMRGHQERATLLNQFQKRLSNHLVPLARDDSAASVRQAMVTRQVAQTARRFPASLQPPLGVDDGSGSTEIADRRVTEDADNS